MSSEGSAEEVFTEEELAGGASDPVPWHPADEQRRYPHPVCYAELAATCGHSIQTWEHLGEDGSKQTTDAPHAPIAQRGGRSDWGHIPPHLALSIAHVVSAVETPAALARRARPRLLHIFGGRINQPGTVGTALVGMGWDVAVVDPVNLLSGGAAAVHDVHDALVWERLLHGIHKSEFDYVLVTLPADTWVDDRARSALRTTAKPYGVKSSDLREPEKKRIRIANTVCLQAVILLEGAATVGAGAALMFLKEASVGPSPRDLPEVQAYIAKYQAGAVEFDRCRYGGAARLRTQLLHRSVGAPYVKVDPIPAGRPFVPSG